MKEKIQAEVIELDYKNSFKEQQCFVQEAKSFQNAKLYKSYFLQQFFFYLFCCLSADIQFFSVKHEGHGGESGAKKIFT